MGVPKPFSRPSISLSTDKREWVDKVPVTLLSTGDIVRGLGQVEQVDIYPEEVSVVWKNGLRSLFAVGDDVTAFVKA